MSKELAFTDDNDVVKYLDTTTAFNLALTANGVAFDLTNAKSVLVKIANDDGYIMQQTIDLTTVTSPLGGTLSFPINQDIMNTLVPDDYDIEVWVTMNDGTQAIFPSDGTLGFSIEENLMSDTGEVIPTITLNDFQQQFNDLSNQMENAVHNVQKGDKGEKGDTGTGLEIKDKVSSVSNLPSTANEGDGYLVGEELYVRVNNAWKDCGLIQGPQGIQGIQGIQGNTGTGISSTTIQYQISNSATTAPTGIWSNNIVTTTTTNPYLWMKATLHYTDGTTKDFYLVSQKGDKGDIGADGRSSYTHIAYANSSDSERNMNNWVLSDPAKNAATITYNNGVNTINYRGVADYEVFNFPVKAKKGQDFTFSFSWTQPDIKTLDGANTGIPVSITDAPIYDSQIGRNAIYLGVSKTNSKLFTISGTATSDQTYISINLGFLSDGVQWQFKASFQQDFSHNPGNHEYMGWYSDFIALDSNDPSFYGWNLIKGKDGLDGAQGPQGPVGTGLVVKGTVNNASQLPKAGNQEGYCYFVSRQTLVSIVIY